MSILLATVIASLVALAVGFVFGRIRPGVAQPSAEEQRLREERLRESFRAAAAEALQANQEVLLQQTKLVAENLKTQSVGELQKQNLEIQKNMAPLQVALQKIEGELRGLEQARTVAYTSLGEQLKELSLAQKDLRTQAGALVQALRDPKTRGNWGELHLRRVVEFAGMVNHVHFSEQVSAQGEGGALRPDLVVHLPNGRDIVVDAKVPLEAYTRGIHVENPDEKKRLMAEHARQLKDHFKKLGSKKYFAEFETPEFVVLFLNLESALVAALEQEPQLIEEALNERVLIATPTTLIALLKAVAYGWGEQKAAAQAQEMVALCRELMERFSVVNEYWQKVGLALGKAVETYNQAVNSTQTRLLVTARKLDETKSFEVTKVQVRPVGAEVKETLLS